MNVLSLFDGMSCGQIALNRIGIKPNKYYASEIDKHAMQVSKANYPNTIYVGDVTKWKEWDIDWSSIDLLLAGSPCQGFSMAGKQLAFDDPRSALFFVFVDIWNHIKKHNPNAHYLLENVRMKQEHENVISRILDIKPIIINSALLSAQNRVRLYWTNIYNKSEGLFGFKYCAIPQPKDKGILLKDVLEDQVDEKYYLSDKLIKGFQRHAERHAERGNGFKFEPIEDTEIKGASVTTKCGQRPSDDYIITHSTQPRSGKGQGGKGHLMKQDQRSYCLDTGNSQAIEIESKIRRLTPVECERLQTVPNNYTAHVSDTQRYKMLGNGWTVDVICHILRFMDKQR